MQRFDGSAKNNFRFNDLKFGLDEIGIVEFAIPNTWQRIA